MTSSKSSTKGIGLKHESHEKNQSSYYFLNHTPSGMMPTMPNIKDLQSIKNSPSTLFTKTSNNFFANSNLKTEETPYK
jgi:hypothetical protein